MRIKISAFACVNLCMSLLITNNAIAGWEEYIEAVIPSVEITSLQSESKVTHEFSPINQITHQVYDAISSAEYVISKGIEEEIVNALYDADNLYKRLRLVSYNFRITGPLKIVLKEKNGVITAKIGGFSIRVYAKVKDKRFLVPTSASVTISSNPIWLDADYDVYTGGLSNLMLGDIGFDTDVSASWINPFGQVAKIVAKSLIPNKLNNGLIAIQDGLAGASHSLLGLNDILPSGVFIIDNVDVGDKTKAALNSLIAGESLTVSMHRKDFYFNTGQQHNSADITINYSNQYQLKLFNNVIIGTYWQSCAPSNPLVCDQIP